MERWTLLLPALAALVACEPEPLPDGQYTVTDADADGFPAGVDCDDSNRQVRPDADELCGDGVDNDCDGEVDEADAVDAVEFFADFDEDGFGVWAYTTWACEAPLGYASEVGDCDDFNPAVNPDAEEVCNEIDDDCDDTIDGAYASGQNIYYRDADGDGYGTADDTTDACTAPVGYSTNTDDCDDAEASVHLGADEVCDDGLDNNCDGLVDETCPYAFDERADLLVASSAQEDELADNALLADLNGDGAEDLVIGGGEFDPGAINKGGVFVHFGPLTAPETSESEGVPTLELESANLVLVGEEGGDWLGYRMETSDLNGDGYEDLIVGSFYAGANSKGLVYVVDGPVTGAAGFGDIGSYQRTTFFADSGQSIGDLGQYVAMSPGDLTGDGLRDVVLGDDAYRGLSNTSNLGRVYLFDGTATGDVLADDATATVTGDVYSSGIGLAAATPSAPGDVVDMNDDGVADLVVGRSRSEDDDSDGEVEGGDLWIYYGPLAGDYVQEDADVQVDGPNGRQFGSAISAGDHNGDGSIDLAVGSRSEGVSGATQRGSIYIVDGPITEDMAFEDGWTDISPSVFVGASSTNYMGSYGFGLRLIDQNGDGFADLVAGTPLADNLARDGGAVYLQFGPLSGFLRASEADRTFVGAGGEDNAGYAVDVGDILGDGSLDLIVGAEGWDRDQGAVGIFDGSGF